MGLARFKHYSVLTLVLFTIGCANERPLIESEYNGMDLQLALWDHLDRGERDEAAKLEKTLRETIESGQCVEKSNNIGGNASKPILLNCDHGIGLVFKVKRLLSPLEETTAGTETSILANFAQVNGLGDSMIEVAAYQVDRLFETHVIPMTLKRQHPGVGIGSAQYFVRNAKLGAGSDTSIGYRRMKILDYILKNDDRHSGNWLYLPSLDRIVAIDHGFSFNNRTEPAHPILSLSEVVQYLQDEPKLKDRIKAIKDSEIWSALANYLPSGQIQKLIDRVHEIQSVI